MIDIMIHYSTDHNRWHSWNLERPLAGRRLVARNCIWAVVGHHCNIGHRDKYGNSLSALIGFPDLVYCFWVAGSWMSQ